MKPSQQIEVTLPDSCSASEAQLAIDRHTVAQLEDAAMTAARVQPATALPWQVNEEDGRVESRGSILFYIAGSLTNKRICADAEYAVHACNNYQRLVSMLRLMLSPALERMDSEARKLLRELGELE